jgi:UTP--glucose-1-phosphate uridylyltransferase
MTATTDSSTNPSRIKKVRKAVLPAAGLGTRFLPATKVIPKEMIPVIDRPVVQYAVEEARAAGIEQLLSSPARAKIPSKIISITTRLLSAT